MFQSSFELTGYITKLVWLSPLFLKEVSKLFRAYRLYNGAVVGSVGAGFGMFQSSFERTGYITYALLKVHEH